jgi:5-methyltetrahydropteroyltriglutamate--homocysteine methyltransferase
MRTSQDHILTSHVGSLPRPDALIEANRARDAGEATNPGAFEATLSAAVMDVVRYQRELGIDVPGDGEFGKSMAQRRQLWLLVALFLAALGRHRTRRADAL